MFGCAVILWFVMLASYSFYVGGFGASLCMVMACGGVLGFMAGCDWGVWSILGVVYLGGVVVMVVFVSSSEGVVGSGISFKCTLLGVSLFYLSNGEWSSGGSGVEILLYVSVIFDLLALGCGLFFVMVILSHLFYCSNKGVVRN
nr:NADH dehydrogenase subunit 6 [Pseudoacanthocephalus sp.]